MAFKTGKDPSSNSPNPFIWNSKWYGTTGVSDASEMSMLWIRNPKDNSAPTFLDWETLPQFSYNEESGGGPDIWYTPTRTDEGLWFTVYGPQTAIGASKGITGQKGEDGNDGQKGDTGADGNDGTKGEKGEEGIDGAKGIDGATNINYQTWDLVNNAFYDACWWCYKFIRCRTDKNINILSCFFSSNNRCI